MGTLIAAVIIIALIFYALKDLLADKDFSAWTNIALTSLILFTVILSIFMILHKPVDKLAEPAPQEEAAPAPQEPAPKTPEEIAAEEQLAKETVADEYVIIEQDCRQNASQTGDCAQNAADFIITKYKLTPEEWEEFFTEATTTGLFDKAREKQKINYIIQK